jgi:hypothetical protein
MATAVAACVLATTPAVPQTLTEYGLKGAFVYNVLKFVHWPPQAVPPDGPLTIAVIARSPVPDLVAALAGKIVDGRALTVTVFADASRMPPAHVVFIASDAAAELRSARRAAEGRPVLTIAEGSGPPPHDAIVTLIVDKARLAFYVNLDEADAQGLQVSANLLSLARRVHSTRRSTGSNF